MIDATIYQVYDDDPNVLDVRIDLHFPWANMVQYVTVGILVDRANLPANYTWDDIATASTAVIDSCGITVVAPSP